MSSRKLVRLRIDSDSLVKLLGAGISYDISGTYKIVNGLPKDSKVVGFYQDLYTTCYWLVFESAEFAEVSEGNNVPEFHIQITQVQTAKVREW